MEYLSTYLAVFLLFLSKVLAEGETKGYLRREHSVLKGEFDMALVNCAPNPSLECDFYTLKETFVKDLMSSRFSILFPVDVNFVL